MRQLSGLDAVFYYREMPGAPMHVGTLMVYDGSTAPGGEVNFESIKGNIARRLHLAQIFRQRILPVPLDADHPYWADDAGFDLEHHVGRVDLPSPGNREQLWVVAAQLLARPLDLSRPPWEIIVIEGLDGVTGTTGGSFAVIDKVHHAAIDGLTGMEVIAAVHDRTPDAVPDPPGQPWKPERVPSPWELLARAGLNNLARPSRLARVIERTMPALVRTQNRQWRDELTPPAARGPRTRFDGAITPDRVVGGWQGDLASVRRAKSLVPDATVNDVLLAVVGGALRRYLASHGELPDKSLVTMVPISVRGRKDKGTGGNRVSAMFAPLATDLADPVARLQVIAHATRASKQLANAIGAKELIEYSEFVPGGLSALASRTATSLGMATGADTASNCVVTNVPGPRTPIYFSGARLVAMFGSAPITDGMGLMHVITSYCGTVSICFTSCPEMLPDPALYVSCLDASHAELSAACG